MTATLKFVSVHEDSAQLTTGEIIDEAILEGE